MSDSKSSGNSPRKLRAKVGASTFATTRLDKAGTHLPALPYRRMKERVLGRRYSLSLVLAGDAATRDWNRTYRKKSYIPNVLSFPLDAETGEVVLNLRQARRECASRGESYRYFVALLFVHALFHLKGLRHGSIMEREERSLLSLFHVKNTARAKTPH